MSMHVLRLASVLLAVAAILAGTAEAKRVRVSEHADEVVKAFSTGDVPVDQFDLSPTEIKTVRAKLKRIATPVLLRTFQESPDTSTRGFAILVLAMKNEQEAIKPLITATVRKGVSAELFEGALREFTDVPLADLEPVFNADLPCSYIEPAMNVVKDAKDRSAAIAIVQRLYASRKWSCGHELIAAYAHLKGADAAPFLSSLPKCTERITVFGSKKTVGGDRVAAMEQLAILGGDASAEAIAKYMRDSLSADEQMDCNERDPYPWAEAGVRALCAMKLEPKRFGTLVANVPTRSAGTLAANCIYDAALSDSRYRQVFAELLSNIPCPMLQAVANWGGSQPIDLSAFKGTAIADEVKGFLDGLATMKRGAPPASPQWKRPAAEEKCSQAEALHAQLVVLAGRIRDERYLDDLVNIYSHAGEVYGLETRLDRIRHASLDSLALLGAGPQLQQIVSAEPDTRLLELARAALATVKTKQSSAAQSPKRRR
jgi:hypothetical protein